MYNTNLFGAYPTIHNATPKYLPINQDTINYLHDSIVALQIKVKKLNVALVVVAGVVLMQAITHF